MINTATLSCLGLLILSGAFGSDTDEVKSLSVMEGETVTLNNDVKVQRDDLILWMFGPQDTRIAQITKQVINMFNSNVKFGDRLQVDSQTGSLTIRNIRSEHTGLYRLAIFSTRGTAYKNFIVTVYESFHVNKVLAACMSAVALVVLVSVMYFLCRKRKRAAQKSFEPSVQTVVQYNMLKQDFLDKMNKKSITEDGAVEYQNDKTYIVQMTV